jgi:hypothetical protein
MKPTPPGPVIMLEFNELTPTLIHRFMAAGHLPNFRRLFHESVAFVTDAQEDQEHLEPWIQWVTLHTGLSYDQHRVLLLGDGHTCEDKRTWDLASDAGLRVWVCGTMNAAYASPINGHVLPDPWSEATESYPSDEFGPYLRFVRANVQEHTNERLPLGGRDYLAFVRFMADHGLSARTVRLVASQLVTERLSAQRRWRRAVLLDRLQWDLFRWYDRRFRPHFATFFSNSTAHFQHMYWRNMDPGAFIVKPTDGDQRNHAEAILEGYRRMDWIVGEALSLAGAGRTLIFSSALGQQPCLKYETSGGKVFYRPKELEAFVRYMGLHGRCKVAPLMSEDFRLVFESEAEASAAEACVRDIRVNDRRAMKVSRAAREVVTGCAIFDELPSSATFTSAAHPNPVPFFSIFYRADGMKSGMHHPHGILWIRRPDHRHAVCTEPVPLKAVAPTILQLLGVPVPPYMSASRLQESAAVLASAGDAVD